MQLIIFKSGLLLIHFMLSMVIDSFKNVAHHHPSTQGPTHSPTRNAHPYSPTDLDKDVKAQRESNCAL